MFNRKYFVNFSVWLNGKEISNHYRIFYVKSWFSEKPEDILEFKIKKWAKELDVYERTIHVMAFNRI